MILIGYILTFLISIVSLLFISFTFQIKSKRRAFITKLISFFTLFSTIPITFYLPEILDYLSLLLLILIFGISIAGLKAVSFISDLIKFGSQKIKTEIFRKSFHLVGLIVFIDPSTLSEFIIKGLDTILNFLPMVNLDFKSLSASNENFLLFIAIAVITSFIFTASVLEFFRTKLGVDVFPEILIRNNEKNDVAAELYIGVGLFFVSVLSNWSIFSAVASSVLLGDAAAAIVGKIFGRTKISNNRTLEGTLAEFLVALLSASYFIGLLPSLLCAFFIAISDIYISSKVDDNLLFPIVAYIGVIIGLAVG